VVAGWGKLSDGTFPDKLQEVEVPIVSEECKLCITFFLTVLIAFIVQNGVVTYIHMVTDLVSIP
jgi:hypothetical protein